MRRIECMVWVGLLLMAGTFGVLAWRTHAVPEGLAGDDGPLWWQPDTPEAPGAPLNRFTLTAPGAGGRLQPVQAAPELDEATTGIRLAWPGATGQTALPGPPPLPLMPTAADEEGNRFWAPDTDAFEILGPRGGGRQPGWLERDVSARQAEAMQAREAGGLFDSGSLVRPGMAPGEGGARILRFESIFDD